ncbi:hypothetical protein AB0H37_42695 [Actinomadura sp. NPDC023710]|uniref:hypothetical protein n=1 Tax=Actinomadura sp. NPDC023710 TaxID=3158219 RepID=UPI0033ED7A41
MRAAEAGPGADDEEEFDGGSVLALIKAMPDDISLEPMLREIDKLTAIRAIGLPEGLFVDVAPKMLASWRARAAVESPPSTTVRAARSPPTAAERDFSLDCSRSCGHVSCGAVGACR